MRKLTKTQKILIVFILAILSGYIVYFINFPRQEDMKSINVANSNTTENLQCNIDTLGWRGCRRGFPNDSFYRCELDELEWQETGFKCDLPFISPCNINRVGGKSCNTDFNEVECKAIVREMPTFANYITEQCGTNALPETDPEEREGNTPPPGSSNGGGGQTGTEPDPGNNNGNNNPGNTNNPPSTNPPVPTTLSTFPNVTCTYFTNYINPTTGKKGPKRCKPNAFGEVMVCEETQRPRADGSGGDGVCVEKKTSVGETCRFNVQCGIEEDYAVGLPFEYELRNIQMRCEKRNSPDGTATPKGFCLPSFRQPLETDPATNPIGCGFNGETDAERDAYCVQQFAVYTQIREGVVGSDHQDPFVSLKVPQNAYCHKIRDAAGNEDRARFECRLKRKVGANCKAEWGNACL